MTGTNDVVTYLLILMNVLFVVIVGAYFLTIYRSQGNKRRYEDYIQGKWIRKGQTAEGEAWYIQYIFTTDTFKIEAVPELHLEGKYRITREVEQMVELYLYDITGPNATNPHYLRIGVDPKHQQLLVDNRYFKRIK